MKHLEGLNPKQKEAVLHTDGPLLVLAGAGAGKTKTITHRIVNLIDQGTLPEEILAVTFTNKAAKEMRERVEKAITMNRSATEPYIENRIPFISTFHSLGVHIIKENARALGYSRYFNILDEGASVTLIKEALKEIGFDPKEHNPKGLKGIISKEKGKSIEANEYKPNPSNPRSMLVAQVWPIYEKKKKKEGALDFDDLLIKSLRLLEEKEGVRKYYQNKWKYIHIDEYQDTNEVQYKMAKILSLDHQNICVVGDADQNIYSWRGANLKNILNFEKDYEGAKIVLLEENYRSTQNILEAANEVIKKNIFRPEKNLFTKNKKGEKISIYEAIDEGDEAEFTAGKILEIVDAGKAQFGEIAILYRANFQSRVLEEAMLGYNIPYQVLGVKFFDRKEIKDILSYIKASLNKDSLSDIKRVINFPKRGIGKASVAKLFSGDQESISPKTRIKINLFFNILDEIKEKSASSKTSELIKFVVKKSGLEHELKNGSDDDLERLENIKELATLAMKYDNLPPEVGLDKLLEDSALATDQDDMDRKKENKNAVKLMTVHASKGLEFKYVFITGLESGLFPHERESDTSNKDQEEERRLFYVALTRAKQKLFLSFTNFRTIFGSKQINTPSEFLSDIPMDLLEKEIGGARIKTIYI